MVLLAGASNRTRLRYLALAAIAPLCGSAMDAIVTGNPLYSLTATAGLAAGTRTHPGLQQRGRLGVDVTA